MGFNNQRLVYNVKDFGAKGDGVTDDTAAFTACSTAIKNAAVANPATWAGSNAQQRGRAKMIVPPGAYLITAEDALLPAPTATTNGFIIEGAGRDITQIIFQPSSTGKYLFNLTSATKWVEITMRDIEFVASSLGSLPNFWHSIGPNTRDYTWERCNFRGTWGNGIFLDGGTNNQDTLAMYHCAVFGTWNTFYLSQNNEQAVDHNFYDMTCEVNSGVMFDFESGGEFNVYGGSLVAITSGVTFFKLRHFSAFQGVHRALLSGLRVELRTADSVFLDSQWSSPGTILVENCDIGAYIGDNTNDNSNTIINYAVTAGPPPSITWLNCTLGGQHKYVYPDSAWQYQKRIIYRDCVIRDWQDAGGALNKLSGAHTLPVTPITLSSTKGFRDPAGSTDTVYIAGQAVTYTGISGNTLTGASGGTGTIATSSVVTQPNFIVVEAASGVQNHGGMPLVKFENCRNGSITSPLTSGITLPVATIPVVSTYGFPASGQLLVGGQTVTYTGKTLTSFTGATGGSGVVAISTGVGLAPNPANLTYQYPFDTDFGWHLSTGNVLRTKSCIIKNARGNFPAAAGALDFWLPLNAMITRVRAFMDAGATANTTNGYIWTLQSTEGSPTILVTILPDSDNPSLGFDVIADTNFICDTDAKRHLQLVGSGTAAESGPGHLIVEYIG